MTSSSLRGTIVLPDKVISGRIDYDENILDIVECTIPTHAPYIFPAFIDIHTHGCNGFGVMDGNEDAILEIAKNKAHQGVSHFLPTTLSATQERLLSSLTSIKNAKERQHTDPLLSHTQADILGIHFEGPYISQSKYKGSQNPDFIREINIEEFETFWISSGENIKLITLAPELPQALSFIEHLIKKDIRVSAGHSAASESQFNQSVKSGLLSGTHLFNGMKEFNHYDLGVAGSLLLNDNLYCEIIADGKHISFSALPMVFRCKPIHKIMCITDSIFCSGLADGNYISEDLPIVIKNNESRTMEGGLAGSLVQMHQILKNMITHFSDIASSHNTLTLANIGRMMAQNQAEFLGLKKIGKIQKNYQANFAVINPDFDLCQTIKRGATIFER